MPRRRDGWPSATSSEGATALKIYFRLPLASARAVIDVCNAHHIPCTAHLEILDAREALAGRAARDRAHHVARPQPAAAAASASSTGRRCCSTTTRAATAATDVRADRPRWPGRAGALRGAARSASVARSHARRVRAPRGRAAGEDAAREGRDDGGGLREDEAADAPRRRGGRAGCRGRSLRGAVCRHAAKRPGARSSCWWKAASRRSRRFTRPPAPRRRSSIGATSSARCVRAWQPIWSSSARIR